MRDTIRKERQRTETEMEKKTGTKGESELGTRRGRGVCGRRGGEGGGREGEWCGACEWGDMCGGTHSQETKKSS